MKTVEVLLQGERIPDIQFLELDGDKTVKDLIAAAAEHRDCEVDGDFHAFAEDGDEPLSAGDPLPKSEPGRPARLHVHRCRRIGVVVTFNGVTEEGSFGPGKTIDSVKKWAAIRGFGMSPQDAAEHVLQIAGATNQPEPDTHIGSLASCPDCLLEFDLVPHKRVEG